jgi:translation initiation factor RLI1
VYFRLIYLFCCSYLDAEQRLIAARVIKRFILHTRKSAFIVEHDFIMATYMADKVVVYVSSIVAPFVGRV